MSRSTLIQYVLYPILLYLHYLIHVFRKSAPVSVAVRLYRVPATKSSTLPHRFYLTASLSRPQVAASVKIVLMFESPRKMQFKSTKNSPRLDQFRRKPRLRPIKGFPNHSKTHQVHSVILPSLRLVVDHRTCDRRYSHGI